MNRFLASTSITLQSYLVACDNIINMRLRLEFALLLALTLLGLALWALSWL